MISPRIRISTNLIVLIKINAVFTAVILIVFLLTLLLLFNLVLKVNINLIFIFRLSRVQFYLLHRYESERCLSVSSIIKSKRRFRRSMSKTKGYDSDKYVSQQTSKSAFRNI